MDEWEGKYSYPSAERQLAYFTISADCALGIFQRTLEIFISITIIGDGLPMRLKR